jgi:hypothetical protein
MEDYKECKFYVNGKCNHEDAPSNHPECIGKNNCGSWQDDIEHSKNYPNKK